MLNTVYTRGLTLALFLSFAFLTACGGGSSGGGLPAKLVIAGPESDAQVTAADRLTVRYRSAPSTRDSDTLSIRLNGVEVAGLFSEPDADDEYKMHASVFALAGAMNIDGSDNTLEAKVLGSSTERRSFIYEGVPEVILTKVANQIVNDTSGERGYNGTFTWPCLDDEDKEITCSSVTSLPVNDYLPRLNDATDIEGIVRNAAVGGLKITAGPSSSPVTDDLTVTNGEFSDQFILSDTNQAGLADIRFSDEQSNPLQDIAWPQREIARALALRLSDDIFAADSPLPQWTASVIEAFITGIENDPIELDEFLDAAQREELCAAINEFRDSPDVSDCSAGIVSAAVDSVTPTIEFLPDASSWLWASQVSFTGLNPVLRVATSEYPDKSLDIVLPLSDVSFKFGIQLLSDAQASASLMQLTLPTNMVEVAFGINTIRDVTCDMDLCDNSTRNPDGTIGLQYADAIRSELLAVLDTELFETAISDLFDGRSFNLDSASFFDLVSLRQPVCDKGSEDCVISSIITHLITAQYNADTMHSTVSIDGRNYVEDQGVHKNAAGSYFVEDAASPVDMGTDGGVTVAVSSNWINQLLLSVYQSNFLSTVQLSYTLGELGVGQSDLDNLEAQIQSTLDARNLLGLDPSPDTLPLNISLDDLLIASINASAVPYIKFLRDAEGGSWIEVHLNELELDLMLPSSEFQPWLTAEVVSNLDDERCGENVSGCLYIDTTMDVKARFRFGLNDDSLPVVDFASDDIMVHVTGSDGSTINNLLAGIPQSSLYDRLQNGDPDLIEPVWSLVGEQRWLDKNHLQSLLPVLVGGFLQQQIQQGLLQLEPQTLVIGCDSGTDPDTLIERFLGDGRALEFVVQGLEVEAVEQPQYLFIKAAARDKADSAEAEDKAFFELNLLVDGELCDDGGA